MISAITHGGIGLMFNDEGKLCIATDNKQNEAKLGKCTCNSSRLREELKSARAGGRVESSIYLLSFFIIRERLEHERW